MFISLRSNWASSACSGSQYLDSLDMTQPWVLCLQRRKQNCWKENLSQTVTHWYKFSFYLLVLQYLLNVWTRFGKGLSEVIELLILYFISLVTMLKVGPTILSFESQRVCVYITTKQSKNFNRATIQPSCGTPLLFGIPNKELTITFDSSST